MTNLSKIRYKVQIAKYLALLALVSGRRVDASELLSVEETRRLQGVARGLKRAPPHRFMIPFAEKSGPRFREYASRLSAAVNTPILLWVTSASVCGALPMSSLAEVNWDFKASVFAGGPMTFTTADVQQSLLIDECLEESEQGLLEIEVQGAGWDEVRY
jgi:hypothetical protein